VDDVISGGETIKQVQKFKEEFVELFSQGGFPLHKWHSSDPRGFEEQQPAKIVSDNAKTLVAMAKWLRKLKRSQVVNDYLARQEIH
jgi:hypothetical protein